MSQADLGDAIVSSGRMQAVVDSVREEAEARGFLARPTAWGEAQQMGDSLHCWLRGDVGTPAVGAGHKQAPFFGSSCFQTLLDVTQGLRVLPVRWDLSAASTGWVYCVPIWHGWWVCGMWQAVHGGINPPPTYSEQVGGGCVQRVERWGSRSLHCFGRLHRVSQPSAPTFSSVTSCSYLHHHPWRLVFLCTAGRVTNLYILAHSAAGLLFSDVMFKSAAGAIMLASTFNNDYIRHITVNTEDWGRWVLCCAVLCLSPSAGARPAHMGIDACFHMCVRGSVTGLMSLGTDIP